MENQLWLVENTSHESVDTISITQKVEREHFRHGGWHVGGTRFESCKCNSSIFGKESSCQCAKFVINQGTLGEARRVVLGKEHLKSVVAKGEPPQFAHG